MGFEHIREATQRDRIPTIPKRLPQRQAVSKRSIERYREEPRRFVTEGAGSAYDRTY